MSDYRMVMVHGIPICAGCTQGQTQLRWILWHRCAERRGDS